MKTCSIEECERKHLARGWCRMHYMRWVRHGDPEGGGRRYKTPEEAFINNTIPEPNTGCLLWLGFLDPNGYGRIGGGEQFVHRYAWNRAHGNIPEGMMIDHICHTPACVNVGHLRLATPSQNAQHRRGAGRDSRLGIRNVSLDEKSNTWRVRVRGKHQGMFASEEEAIQVAEQKRLELFREFAGKG